MAGWASLVLLLDGEREGGGVGDGGDSVAGLGRDRNRVGSSRGGRVNGRTVVLVVIPGVAAGGAEDGDQADQGHKGNALEPWTAAERPGKTAKAECAGEQNGPGDGAGTGMGERGGGGGLRKDDHGACDWGHGVGQNLNGPWGEVTGGLIGEARTGKRYEHGVRKEGGVLRGHGGDDSSRLAGSERERCRSDRDREVGSRCGLGLDAGGLGDGAEVGGVARIGGLERMRARRESDGNVGVALRIKGGAGKLAAVVAEDDSSGSGKAVFAQDGDGDGGRCAPGQ